MRHFPLPTLLVTFVITPLAAQDIEYLRALEKTQEARPATLTVAARIAPESEPGTPLVIHGHAFAEDGKTPLANAIIFAYHTGKDGLYDRPGRTLPRAACRRRGETPAATRVGRRRMRW